MSKTYSIGGWVTADLKSICHYVDMMKKATKVTHPALLALKELIETDPQVNMLFTTMFHQKFEPPQPNPISDYMDMLFKMQTIIESPPVYKSKLGNAPLNHLLIYVMATHAGTMAFINEKVNKCFREILNAWAQLLNHPDSRAVLNKKDGWLSPEALKDMGGDFLNTYKVDLEDPYYGFTCWNDFFARRLKDETVRPIADPDDPYSFCSPCDATPYFICKNPKYRDKFWIKRQPYSLQHLLDDDELCKKYVGGTVYQAFLNTANYHRWHSPVNGKITKAYIKKGAYYAESPSVGYDPTANTYSQRYLSHVDNRAIFHIDTEKLGIVIFVAIGMAEISSCIIQTYFGQEVKKGEMIGTFQFGGSSYCLLFEKGLNLHFDAEDIPKKEWNTTLQKVNSSLGRIKQHRTPLKGLCFYC